MPKPAERALVHWTKDDQVGLEPISHVPAGSRFPGAVSTVMFSGDKKWYPAKVIMISDNSKALSDREEELVLSITKKREEQEQKKGNSKRARTKTKSQGSASLQDIAKALGMKAPPPKHLEAEVNASKNDKKETKAHKEKGQRLLDTQVAAKCAKKLFEERDESKKTATSVDSSAEDLDEEEEDEGDDDNSISKGEMSDAESIEDAVYGAYDETRKNQDQPNPSDFVNCGCASCLLLHKYDNPSYVAFLQDLQTLFTMKNKSCDRMELSLKPIPKGAKQVELTIGSGVFIEATTKAQLKVDFSSKPSSLIRETLFALYGKETFRTLHVTARGHKEGSYGLPEHVLKAVSAFVNRNVAKKQKFQTFVHTINKRALEWRKVGTTPPSKSKRSKFSTKPVSSEVDKSINIGEDAARLMASSPPPSPSKFQRRATSMKSPKRPSPKKMSPKKSSPNKRSPMKAGPSNAGYDPNFFSQYSNPQYSTYHHHQYPHPQYQPYPPYQPYQPHQQYLPGPDAQYNPPHNSSYSCEPQTQPTLTQPTLTTL